MEKLEEQVNFKFAGLEQVVQRQQVDENSVSFTRLHDDVNNFYNIDDMSFSVINKASRDESELMDVKDIQKSMGNKGTMLSSNKKEDKNPRKLSGMVNVNNYKANVKVIKPKEESMNKGNISGFSNNYSFMKSTDNPDRKNNAPYTPEMVKVQQNLTVDKDIVNKPISMSHLKQSLVQFNLNNVSMSEVIIDDKGFLMDQNNFPILDDNGNVIKLNGNDIKTLKKNNLFG